MGQYPVQPSIRVPIAGGAEKEIRGGQPVLPLLRIQPPRLDGRLDMRALVGVVFHLSVSSASGASSVSGKGASARCSLGAEGLLPRLPPGAASFSVFEESFTLKNAKKTGISVEGCRNLLFLLYSLEPVESEETDRLQGGNKLVTDAHRKELSRECRQIVEEPTKRGFRVKLII